MDYQKLLKPLNFVIVLSVVIFSYFSLDLPCAFWIKQHLLCLKPLTKLVYIIFCGAIVIPMTIILVLLSFKFSKLHAWRNWLIQLLLSLLSAQLILAITKVLVGRARPYQALMQGYQSFEPLHLNNAFFSFPSGHTLNITLIAIFLGSRYPNHEKKILGLGLLISFFRVLGLDHFLSDWFFTVYLAGVIYVLTQAIFNRYLKLRG